MPKYKTQTELHAASAQIAPEVKSHPLFNTPLDKPTGKFLMAWSTGKDAANAFGYVQREFPDIEIVGLMTTHSPTNLSDEDSVAFHYTELQVARAQAHSIGLPLLEVSCPLKTDKSYPVDFTTGVNEQAELYGLEFDGIIYGDIYLPDVVSYRFNEIHKPNNWIYFAPLITLSPEQVWEEFVKSGIQARICSVDTSRVSTAKLYLNKTISYDMLAMFHIETVEGQPQCCQFGEQGEYHSLTYDANFFKFPIPVEFNMDKVKQDGRLMALQPTLNEVAFTHSHLSHSLFNQQDRKSYHFYRHQYDSPAILALGDRFDNIKAYAAEGTRYDQGTRSNLPEFKVLLCWSGGKDSMLAFHELHHMPNVEVVGLVSTVCTDKEDNNQYLAYHHVPMVAIREQAERLGLPLLEVEVPPEDLNRNFAEAYNTAFDNACSAAGIEANAIAYGDLYLAEPVVYKVNNMLPDGWTLLAPLYHHRPCLREKCSYNPGPLLIKGSTSKEQWQIDQYMMHETILLELFNFININATVIRVNHRLVNEADKLIGKQYQPKEDYIWHIKDRDFKPADRMGERGEFHTFVTDCGYFSEPVATEMYPSEYIEDKLTLRLKPLAYDTPKVDE